MYVGVKNNASSAIPRQYSSANIVTGDDIGCEGKVTIIIIIDHKIQLSSWLTTSSKTMSPRRNRMNDQI